jgi:hypothetical protein
VATKDMSDDTYLLAGRRVRRMGFGATCSAPRLSLVRLPGWVPQLLR